MTKPNFLIIGAAKCGTTSLQRYLRQHPDIYMPEKEQHFFSKKHNIGLDNYLKIFNHEYKINGEKSTSYFYYEDCHERIKKHFPDIKLILMLRDPVRRAFSNWNMRCNDGRIISDGLRFNHKNGNLLKKLDFDYLVDFYIENKDNKALIFQKPMDVIHRSCYAEQLSSLLNYFPLAQIKIIIFEEFIQNPQIHLKEVFSYLGVDNYKSIDYSKSRKANYSAALNEEPQKRLQALFEPMNKILFKTIGQENVFWNY